MVYLNIVTCAQSMQRGSPLCQKICNYQDVFVGITKNRRLDRYSKVRDIVLEPGCVETMVYTLAISKYPKAASLNSVYENLEHEKKKLIRKSTEAHWRSFKAMLQEAFMTSKYLFLFPILKLRQVDYHEWTTNMYNNRKQ